MNIIVTDKEEGPKGWNMFPVEDEYVYYNPEKISEEKMIQMIEDYRNGDMEEMFTLAKFDTELDRE